MVTYITPYRSRPRVSTACGVVQRAGPAVGLARRGVRPGCGGRHPAVEGADGGERLPCGADPRMHFKLGLGGLSDVKLPG